MEEKRMIYEFKINGKVVEPSEIASLKLEQEQLQELLETGSLEADSVYNEGDADATITITTVLPVKNYQNPVLSKEALMMAVFSIISVLDEDNNGDIPKKYQDVGIQLGNKLIDMDITYDDILDEMIILLGDLI